MDGIEISKFCDYLKMFEPGELFDWAMGEQLFAIEYGWAELPE